MREKGGASVGCFSLWKTPKKLLGGETTSFSNNCSSYFLLRTCTMKNSSCSVEETEKEWPALEYFRSALQMASASKNDIVLQATTAPRTQPFKDGFFLGTCSLVQSPPPFQMCFLQGALALGAVGCVSKRGNLRLSIRWPQEGVFPNAPCSILSEPPSGRGWCQVSVLETSLGGVGPGELRWEAGQCRAGTRTCRAGTVPSRHL